MEILETNRLLLRPFEPSDARAVQTLASDIEIARTTLNIPHPYPDGAAEAYIESLRVEAAEGKNYGYAIVRKGDHTLLGCMAIMRRERDRRGELVYWLGKPFWGQGYTTEAAVRVMEFGFEQLNLHKVFAAAFTTNPASTRVMEKIGMKYEGTLAQHIYKWGEFVDLAYYGILRPDYERMKQNLSQ